MSPLTSEDELLRRGELENLKLWGSILSTDYVLDKSIIHSDRSTAVHPPDGHRTAIQIVEIKNEIRGGSDLILQAEHSYSSIFCSSGVGLFSFTISSFY